MLLHCIEIELNTWHVCNISYITNYWILLIVFFPYIYPIQWLLQGFLPSFMQSSILILFLFSSAAVVQLKSLISAFSNNDKTPDYTLEKIGTLQKILVCVVSVICNLIDSIPDKSEKDGSDFTIDCGALMASKSLDKQVGNDTVVISDFKMEWRHRAITSLLEAGGVNWLVGKVCSFSLSLSLCVCACVRVHASVHVHVCVCLCLPFCFECAFYFVCWSH